MAAARLDGACHLLLWQPAGAGKALLQQFLRLKAAADIQHGDAKSTMDALRAALAAGHAVDIAGYSLQPALTSELEQAVLDIAPPSRQVVWLEVAAREAPALLPASSARIEAWRAAGHSVAAAAVPGPAFWQTQEIEDAPALIDATLAALTASAATAAAKTAVPA